MRTGLWLIPRTESVVVGSDLGVRVRCTVFEGLLDVIDGSWKNFLKISPPRIGLSCKVYQELVGMAGVRSVVRMMDQCLTYAPVLAWSEGMMVVWSIMMLQESSLGCIMMQRGRVIAYASRQLKTYEVVPCFRNFRVRHSTNWLFI